MNEIYKAILRIRYAKKEAKRFQHNLRFLKTTMFINYIVLIFTK